MSQIRKGFIAANAIDGSKLKLLNNEAIRAAQADGADVELMKLDGSNVLQFLKLPQVSADPSQDNDVARKGYVDAQVSAANSSAASGLASEQAARQSADSGLQSAIDTEKGRIDAILSAATADADSFAEIVSLINSVDTTNDSAFGSYVLSNNAALAQEAADRAAGDAELASDISDEASARQSADTALQGNLDQEVSDRQAAVSGEASARQSADAGLQSQIDALDSGSSAGLAQEVADRQAADSAEQAAREAADSAETAARQAADSAEQSARESADATLQGNIDSEAASRQAADTTLQGNIDTEKARIDAILTASSADKDSFAEIVNLINSVDTENDSAFGSYVVSNNAALAQEVSDRQAAVSAEQSARESADSAETAARQAADTSLQGEVDAVESALAQEVSDRQAAVSAEQSARESADSAETSARQAADSAEQAAREAADSAEASARQAADSAEQAAREAADSALDVRVDAIEAVTSRKEKFVLSSGDLMSGYVDLAVTCKADSELVFIGSLYAHDGDDYTVSTVNGKTRITFVGPLAAGGLSQLTEGDAVYVRYLSSETANGGGGGGGGGDGTPSSAGFMSASFGAATGTVNWFAYGATTEQVRLEYDMAGFWLNVASLGLASTGSGYTSSPLNLGGTYRLVFTDMMGMSVIGSPSQSFTYQGAGGGGPAPETYSFPMVIGQTDNGDGTTTFDWLGANLPMMQEVRVVKLIGPGMYDSINGINLGVLTPTSSGIISNASVNSYDSYALQSFMGPTATATSASFQIPSGTGI